MSKRLLTLLFCFFLILGGATSLRAQYEGAYDSGTMVELSGDLTPQLGGPLDTNSHQVNWSKGADVASANALVLGVDGNYFDITGVTAITSIGTLGIGTVVCLHFDGILTFTHNATDLILPGGVNKTTAAGDEAILIEYAAGDWRCINYSRASNVTAFNDIKQDATETTTGVNERATNAETVTGTATNVVTTPANITAKMSAPGAIGTTTGIPSIGFDHNVETLAANKTLTTSDLVIQRLDPDGSDRDVTLPAEASSTDLMFCIYNTANGAAEDLVVKDDTPATIITLGPGMTGLFSCDGTTWECINDMGVFYDAVNDRVGIGTTSLVTKLQIAQSSAETTAWTAANQESIRIQNTDNTNNNWQEIIFADAGGGAITGISTRMTDHTNHYGELYFATKGPGSLTSQMMIDNSGNVGIGTTIPSEKLEVIKIATAGADGRCQLIPKIHLQGTGALTNGTTNTKVTYIDATPVGEWTGTDADIASSTNATYYKEGAASLKVTIADAASAGDVVLNPLTAGDENWTGNESIGMWIYSTVVLSVGDLDFRITDSVAGNTDTDIPAVPITTWTWVEVDISGVADASKDVITDIALVYTVDIGAVNVYFDFLAKWDAADETALDKNLLKDGMCGVIANPIAAATAMAWVSQTEYTDYFINYATAGNGNLVVITDESLNCFIMNYCYE